MIDESALRKAFAEYAETLLRRYEVGEVLYRLTDQVVELLDLEAAGVSLSAGDDDGLAFVTATDERIARLGRLQEATGEGPSTDALRSGRLVACHDLQPDTRWPRYRDAALAEGLTAVAAIPMPVSGQPIGALDLYAPAGPWPADDLQTAALLANVATGYVVHAQALEDARTLQAQLQQALDSRVVIEQAKGIVAERHDIDVGSAFELLRRHSRQTSTRLHEVCRRVIAGELRL